MNRALRFTLLGLAAVVVLPSLAVGTSGQMRGNAKRTMTIRLVSTITSHTETDRPPKGGSKGDKAYVRSTLRNAVPQFGRPKGAVVGSDYEVFTVVSPSVVDVAVAVILPGGTLRLHSRFDDSTPPLLRVVGGTGRYRQAGGTSAGENLPDGRSRNTYRLRLP